METIDKILNSVFPGLVVRKDLVKKIKGNAVVPTYVLEYLLGQYCATNDEMAIEAGIENVKKILQEHYVNRNEAELIKSRIKERGSWKVIDKVTVDLNDRKGIYQTDFSNLGLRNVPIDADTVKANKKLLVGGVWSLVDVEYEAREEKEACPWAIRSLKPIQLSHFDLANYLEAREKVSADDWIDVLIQSLGLNPEIFGRRDKFFQLLRLVPFCERNYNLIELGPKGTGKSHVYSECSPHGMLLSGGEVTVPKLFVTNTSSGKIGLVGFWDCIAFDEFAGKQKRVDKALVDIMKNYMANKTFSRGIETIGAEASFAFVGNTMHTVPQMLKNYNLFEQLPDMYLDSAFIDRIHTYIPGWEVKIIRGEMFTSGYGFVVDYLSEILHALRDRDYSNVYQKYFTLSPTVSTRDRDGINKTFSGLMKILYPSAIASKEQIKELLEYAIEGRKRVKDQLLRIDSTYDLVDFSYTDNASGEKHKVLSLEERQYPQLYKIGMPSPEQPEEPTSPEPNLSQPEQGHASAGHSAPRATLAPTPRPEDADPTQGRREVVENEKGVDYTILFGAYVKGAEEILIVDPYVRTFHQARNVMEFMEMLIRLKAPEDDVTVVLKTEESPEDPKRQSEYLEKIRAACELEGITFEWRFESGLHDRSITTNTGWVIGLGRGLDIYQPFDGKDAFSLENRIPSLRSCKAFSVSYFKK